MRRLALATTLLLAVLLGATVARGETELDGNLLIHFDGGFSPRSLPRDRPAPVTVKVEGEIGTTDGSQPPPLQRLEIALNRNGRLFTQGLPACTSRLLQSTTTQTALKRCRPALVGRGHFGANVDFPSVTPFPAKGAILAFNGRQNGKPALLLHLYGTAPVQVSFVLPLIISHKNTGLFGTVLSAKIPTLASGLGSVTEISLEIGREYTYRGQPRSFISAACAAPEGFPGAVFVFAQGRFHFAGGQELKTTLARNCRVR
jgi:hypothetical protein